MVDGHAAGLDPDESQNAALIAAIATKRGLPAHAVTIALATAMQESKLYNLNGGDRDSLGLFQQRPSQGWGTKAEVMDPVHATNAFYDALVKIPDYLTLDVTKAAQEVQHSAYPEAYAKHEPDARALASALTGFSPHSFGCRYDKPKIGSGHPSSLATEVSGFFGGTPVVRGKAVTFRVLGSTQAGRTRGWALAQYVVAQAKRFGVSQVSFDGYRWSAGASDQWAADDAATAGQVGVLLA